MPASSAVAGLLLAAGAGRRFGRPKALIEFGGRLFVESAAELLATAGCAPVAVVLGAAADQVRARAELTGAIVLDNPDWVQGMGSSLRVGLRALAGVPVEVTAAVVLPVDVPGVGEAAVRRLAALAGPDALARATYHGAPGHPVLLGRAHWAAIGDSASGDAGARDYLREHRPLALACEDVASGADVDTPADLDAALLAGYLRWRAAGEADPPLELFAADAVLEAGSRCWRGHQEIAAGLAETGGQTPAQGLRLSSRDGRITHLVIDGSR